MLNHPEKAPALLCFALTAGHGMLPQRKRQINQATAATTLAQTTNTILNRSADSRKHKHSVSRVYSQCRQHYPATTTPIRADTASQHHHGKQSAVTLRSPKPQP